MNFSHFSTKSNNYQIITLNSIRSNDIRYSCFRVNPLETIKTNHLLCRLNIHPQDLIRILISFFYLLIHHIVCCTSHVAQHCNVKYTQRIRNKFSGNSVTCCLVGIKLPLLGSRLEKFSECSMDLRNEILIRLFATTNHHGETKKNKIFFGRYWALKIDFLQNFHSFQFY